MFKNASATLPSALDAFSVPAVSSKEAPERRMMLNATLGWSSIAFAFVALVTIVIFLMPRPAHAQLGYWAMCSGHKAKTEGRSVDIRDYLRVNTIGMDIDDIEDLYCVSPIKCVALGHCKAASPAEQAAADQLKGEIAVEEARLERIRQAKAAEVKAEMRRLNMASHREGEAKRLLEMRVAAERARGKFTNNASGNEGNKDDKQKNPRCEGVKSISVSGHSSQSVVNKLLFQGWKSRAEALSKAKSSNGGDHLAYWCEVQTGSRGYGAVKESCSQNAGRWECSVEATCSKQVSKCPAGAQ